MSSHYFIAIHLPEMLQNYFSKLQQELKRELPYKQWPHKRDLHITLKFLGPVADNEVSLLQHQLQNMEQSAPFTLETGGLGTFGNPKKPRVLWAGVEKTEQLKQLQEKVEEHCLDAGYEKEKRDYRPHITLAKKWNGKEIENINEVIRGKKLEMQKWHVKNIVLFRIHPQKNPKYEAVSIYPLQGGGSNGTAH